MEKSRSLIFKDRSIKNTPKFHLKNKHKSGYASHKASKSYPELLPFVFENKYETKTIDFANPKAVKVLNAGLLFKYYSIEF